MPSLRGFTVPVSNKVWQYLWVTHQRKTPMRCQIYSYSTHVVDNRQERSEDFQSDEEAPTLHVPVLLNEVVEILQPKDGQVFIDMTFGAGGHSKALLKQANLAKLFVLDRDPLAYHLAKQLASQHGQLTPLMGRFSDLPELLSGHRVTESSVDGVLFDVGVSSMQFDEAHRGFALSKDGPLDMRMDGDRDNDLMTAADVVNLLDDKALSLILKKYGEEKQAKKIARAIVESRYAFGKITTTKQLADLISNVFRGQTRTDKLGRSSHPATKTFQALRIFVNNELNELHNGLAAAHNFLKPGGRCAVISFHSLEDRIVKRNFHGIDIDEKFNMNVVSRVRNSATVHGQAAMDQLLSKKWQPLSQKVLAPTCEDSVDNPRSRSAKLRAAVKIL